MKLFKQSEGMCGPASIRIVLSAFGKRASEKKIASLAKSTHEKGTTHEGMITAVKELGLDYVDFRDLNNEVSLGILRKHVNAGHPVVVEWLKTKLQKGGYAKVAGMKPGVEETKTEDSEHYSVVEKVTDKFIYLLDPLEIKSEKLPIEYFMDRWNTISEKANRWFLVIYGRVE